MKESQFNPHSVPKIKLNSIECACCLPQQISSHGLFDLVVDAEGDTWIDDHHTNEDIALALGTALGMALKDRKGIHRFGDFSAPLDEALVHVVLVRSYNID